MQDYDFIPGLNGASTNTSSKSVSIDVQPSPQVIKNIRNYARCIQQVTVRNVKITLYLN